MRARHRHGPREMRWVFGPGFAGPPGPRGPRKRRGDVRAAILLLLSEEPRNGYQLMEEVERRSDGNWRPSPGSIYPALAQLEDEGLIAPAEGGEGKAFSLTKAGTKHVEEHRERLGTPWEDPEGGPAGGRGLKDAFRQVAMASWQVAQLNDPKLNEQVIEILGDTRKRLYQLLADADGGD